MNRSLLLGFVLGSAVTATIFTLRGPASLGPAVAAAEADRPSKAAVTRVYDNTLTPIPDPKPLLADFPQYVEPVIERKRYEAPRLVRRPSSWSTPGRWTTSGAGGRRSPTG
jgi:hypothetical protein